MMLLASLAAASAGRQAVALSQSSGFSDVPLPSGSASMTIEWEIISGVDGYLVYISSDPEDFPHRFLYAYNYVVSGSSVTSRTISGIAAGTYYVRVAGYIGSVVTELSHEITKVAA